MTRAEAIVVQTRPVPAAVRVSCEVHQLPMGDDELELHIQACGDQMRLAHSEGRRTDAMDWLRRQNDAIKARSPEQVRRMEVERGIT
jgi:hypothetical protein